jgi:hypothetical protein
MVALRREKETFIERAAGLGPLNANERTANRRLSVVKRVVSSFASVKVMA